MKISIGKYRQLDIRLASPKPFVIFYDEMDTGKLSLCKKCMYLGVCKESYYSSSSSSSYKLDPLTDIMKSSSYKLAPVCYECRVIESSLFLVKLIKLKVYGVL